MCNDILSQNIAYIINNDRVSNPFSQYLNIVHFEGDKNPILKGHISYDKQNLILMVIFYEIYETHQRFVS